MTSRHRRTSRILVIDDDDRVLLFLTKGSVPAQHTRWITPGGGVDAGESHHEGARRELFEETGQVADDLGEPVASYDFAVDYEGGDHDTGHAEFYLLRTQAFDPSNENWTPSERVDVLDHRWWTLTSLETTDEEYEPADLPALVARMIGGGGTAPRPTPDPTTDPTTDPTPDPATEEPPHA